MGLRPKDSFIARNLAHFAPGTGSAIIKGSKSIKWGPALNDYQRTDDLRRRLPESLELEEIKMMIKGLGEVVTEGEVVYKEHVFPIYSFAIGSKGPNLPKIAFIGGVHGLERVGTNIAISYIKTILELIHWDKGLQFLLERCRLVFLPLVNPIGMYNRTRSNGNGVDLMRNAPINAEGIKPYTMIGGHRISHRLPWFRGNLQNEMEKESQILCDFIRRELFDAPFSFALDMHSGFGVVDRIWFPFAYTKKPFEHTDLMYALKIRLDKSLPNHYYLMEPQSKIYLTHGDLWDYLFIEHRNRNQRSTFLPLTLEMGSWLWIKKNPRQIFNAMGIFNPIIPHRLQRTLRRHLALLDCLTRLVASNENWVDKHSLIAEQYDQKAKDFWFSKAT